MKEYHPSEFWGKYDKDTNEWLSINDHCADVAACFEAIVSTSILRKRLAKLLKLEDLDEVLIARLSVFAALHDVGKCCHGFQNLIDKNKTNKIRSNHIQPVLEIRNKSSEEVKKLREKFDDAIDLNTLKSWFFSQEDAITLFRTSMGHHGGPVKKSEKGFNHILLWSESEGKDPLKAVEDLGLAIKEWFPKAFSGSTHALDLDEDSNPEFAHAFAGILMLADWMGSNKKTFLFETPEKTCRILFSRQKANEFLEEIAFNPKKYRDDFNQLGTIYPKIFKHNSLRACQQILADLNLSSDPSLIILESETGSGKTEASMVHFFNMYRKGYVDGLFFALPTRTAATQLFNRLTAYVKNAFHNPPPVTLAVPGILRSDDLFGQQKGRFECEWDEIQKEGESLRHWAAEEPRHYLAGAIVVGTIDQILMSSLKIKHSYMRASSLLRHLIIIDEVHASDVYMSRITEKVLEFHLKAGGHALLMSATLSSEAKKCFIKCLKTKNKLLENQEHLSEIHYPLLTVATKSDSYVPPIPFKNESLSKSIKIKIMPIIEDASKIAEIGFEAAKKGAKVVILRNTVVDAITTQEALEKLAKEENQLDLLFSVRGKTTLHHARFCREDRDLLDDELEKILGGKRIEKGVVIVATQTIQQSLDLDADFMITDLCPMDVLLQRLGRLHRHIRIKSERPEVYQKPTALILVSSGGLELFLNKKYGPHGFGTVYQNLLILENTLRILKTEGELNIPDENRRYIEETVTSLASENLIKIEGEYWQEHFNEIHGKKCASQNIASQSVVNRLENYPDSALADEFEKIRSRLGLSDIKVVFENEMRSPFGEIFKQLNLPGYQFKGVPLETLPEKISQEKDRITFFFGDKFVIYDHLGIRIGINQLTEPEYE